VNGHETKMMDLVLHFYIIFQRLFNLFSCLFRANLMVIGLHQKKG